MSRTLWARALRSGTSYWRRWLDRRGQEGGYATMLVAVMVPTVFLGASAIAVDTARWYVEMERVQRAADAAALAGVPYLPQDLASATTLALEIAKRNGYDDADAAVEVEVGLGETPSKLKVTVSSAVSNTFGSMIGIGGQTITRSATADFKGPAPMGSPCNTFGNEPSAGAGALARVSPTGTARGPVTVPNCTSAPQFRATVEGPDTDKGSGDRHATVKCPTVALVDGCASKGGANTEFEPYGYFFAIQVQKEAVGSPVKLQLYDPAFVNTGPTCALLPERNAFSSRVAANDYVGVNDQVDRYAKGSAVSATGAPFCNGDYTPGTGTSSGYASHQMTTSFAVREQTDTLNPARGAVIAGCVKQYTGQLTAPTAASLDKATSTYNDQLAQVFHNWTQLCEFTPQRQGDYYLQVQTSVAPGGSARANGGATPIIYEGNSQVGSDAAAHKYGWGNNSFGIRAVTAPGKEHLVAVSGYDRMPIFANVSNPHTRFNLIRVLPGAAGQYVTFSFFDAGDVSSGSATGDVVVTVPTDAKHVDTGGPLPEPFPGGCRAIGGNAGSTSQLLTNCTARITSTANNGKVETITIPIPNKYTCAYLDQGGCWYGVSFKINATANDITTWGATVMGDPVRLVE